MIPGESGKLKQMIASASGEMIASVSGEMIASAPGEMSHMQ